MPAVPSSSREPTFISEFLSRKSRWISQVAPVPFDGFVRQIAHSAGPSPYFALVKDAEKGVDTIEVWDVLTHEKRGEASIIRDAGTDPRIILSPDGYTIARITRFPRSALNIVSVRPGGRKVSLALGDHTGAPTLIGFPNARRLVMRWDRGSENDTVETWDLQTLRVVNEVPVMHAMPTFVNGILSPDGRNYVVAVNAPHIGPQIRVYPLLTNDVKPNISPIEKIDSRIAESPTGLAFSHDGRRFAILYERGNEAVLTYWKIKAIDGTLDVPRQFILPLRPDRHISRHGLEWLNAYDAWLIRGDLIVNADTGQIKGELDPPDFADQWTADVHTLAYCYFFEERAYLALVRHGPTN